MLHQCTKPYYSYWNWNFPMIPLVRQSVGWSVCQSWFRVSLPCPYRSTCLLNWIFTARQIKHFFLELYLYIIVCEKETVCVWWLWILNFQFSNFADKSCFSREYHVVLLILSFREHKTHNIYYGLPPNNAFYTNRSPQFKARPTDCFVLTSANKALLRWNAYISHSRYLMKTFFKNTKHKNIVE